MICLSGNTLPGTRLPRTQPIPRRLPNRSRRRSPSRQARQFGPNRCTRHPYTSGCPGDHGRPAACERPGPGGAGRGETAPEAPSRRLQQTARAHSAETLEADYYRPTSPRSPLWMSDFRHKRYGRLDRVPFSFLTPTLPRPSRSDASPSSARTPRGRSAPDTRSTRPCAAPIKPYSTRR